MTSVDISEIQLEIAAGRAVDLGLQIDFVRADVADLIVLHDAVFDIVYTGGHVAVWLSDLNRCLAEAARILKPGGMLLINEYHPIRRLWTIGVDGLKLKFGYFEAGPFEYDRANDISPPPPDSLPSFEHHWKLSDFVSALLAADCTLIHLEEVGAAAETWEKIDLRGLRQCLLLAGIKK